MVALTPLTAPIEAPIASVEFSYAVTPAERVRARVRPSLRKRVIESADKTTRLCFCMQVTRRDGTVLGFTDHDEDVVLDGVTYEASSGVTASNFEASSTLEVDTWEVFGALISDRLTEDDLAAHAYDNAAFKLYLVDWETPRANHLMLSGSIGEVERGRTAYKAELRSLTHYLNQEIGRVYSKRCDADLADLRCTKSLETAAFLGTGTVTDVLSTGTYLVSGIDAFEDQWFKYGELIWISGQNATQRCEVNQHTVQVVSVLLEMWDPPPFTVQAGDTFQIRAGCDKKWETCRDKFNNIVNFRGFPKIPGNDVISRFGSKDDDNSGSSGGGGKGTM